MGASIPGSARAEWLDNDSLMFSCHDNSVYEYVGNLGDLSLPVSGRDQIDIDLDADKNVIYVSDYGEQRLYEMYIWKGRWHGTDCMPWSFRH